MNKLVCLDTNIIIWGIKQEATPGQEDMIPKSVAFLRKLDETGTKIAIPSVVLAEAMLPIPKQRHDEFIRGFYRTMMVYPLDARVSALTAEIWYEKCSHAHRDQINNGAFVSRDHLKLDCLILATAISAGAIVIYSQDGHLEDLAEGRIQVCKVPEIASQLELFDPNASDVTSDKQ